MRILLFRHGPAGRRDASRWPDDDLRPLTPRGVQRTQIAAAGLARLCTKPARILTSPLLRAEQTARILADACERARVETLDLLRPGTSYRPLVEHLQGLGADETVALVGHEPDLGRLAGVLLFGAPRALPLKKAGACLIEFVGPFRPGEGRLKWFATPRLLRRVAGKRSRV